MTQAAARSVPAYLHPPGPSPYHRLNPLTKVLAATVVAMDALIVGGIVGPLALILAGVILPATTARVVRRLVSTALLLSLPLAVSVLIVNVFFFPGGEEILFRIGPISVSAEGIRFAAEVLVRILAISSAITLFYLTTRPADFVIDLERRGVPPRLAFVANASVQTVPAMVERANAITAAQRARGLDTEGSVWRRLRGLLPIVAPVVLGSIGEVEERTMALEARAFGRPGRRTLLWHPPDRGVERLARWLLVASVPGLLVARTLGWLA